MRRYLRARRGFRQQRFQRDRCCLCHRSPRKHSQCYRVFLGGGSFIIILSWTFISYNLKLILRNNEWTRQKELIISFQHPSKANRIYLPSRKEKVYKPFKILQIVSLRLVPLLSRSQRWLAPSDIQTVNRLSLYLVATHPQNPPSFCPCFQWWTQKMAGIRDPECISKHFQIWHDVVGNHLKPSGC